MAGTKTVPTGIVEQSRPAVRFMLPAEADMARLDKTDQAILRMLHGDSTEFVEYMDHEIYSKPGVEKTLFGRKQTLSPGQTRFKDASPREGFGGSGDGATLSTAHEILLFQQFNYARTRVSRLICNAVDRQMAWPELCELLAWMHRAMDVREVIAGVNMPLVLAMAKRTRLSCLDYNELVSEGNFALLRSIDKFDCARGFKFSTYACRAILKSFSRVAMRASRYRGQFPTEFDPFLEKSDFKDRKRDDTACLCVDEIRDILSENRADLNEMEQTVIRERFALEAVRDGSILPKTLEQVGLMIGVTKERVRQIQNKALKKIRMTLEESLAA
jgi:RNA polymerase primary sigma factor